MALKKVTVKFSTHASTKEVNTRLLEFSAYLEDKLGAEPIEWTVKQNKNGQSVYQKEL